MDIKELPETYRGLYSIYSGDTDSPPDVEVIQALDLMLEMAEAIEYDLEADWTVMDSVVKLRVVLDKFKSWK